MKSALTLLLVGSVALACVGSETGPDVPTGLVVTLSTVTTTPPLPESASITASGDSAVAIVVRQATCGRTISADAGITAAGLVITISLTSQNVQACDPIFGSTTYRAVAHGVAPGTYPASINFRYVFQGTVMDSTVARATVALP